MDLFKKYNYLCNTLKLQQNFKYDQMNIEQAINIENR